MPIPSDNQIDELFDTQTPEDLYSEMQAIIETLEDIYGGVPMTVDRGKRIVSSVAFVAIRAYRAGFRAAEKHHKVRKQ